MPFVTACLDGQGTATPIDRNRVSTRIRQYASAGERVLMLCVYEGECDMGDFTGKCYEQLKDTPEYQRFLDVNDGFIPNGECKEVFHARCLRGFDEIVRIIEEKGAKKPAIVSHGGVIMALMNNFTDEMTVFFDYQTTNGGGYVVEFDTETRKFEILETLK